MPDGRRTSASAGMRAKARALRRDQTDAEQRIWSALRAHRLDGHKFRRQKPIGPYIVDFVCEAAGLIIEIDGGQHHAADGIAKDASRDAFLRSKGYSVLRFGSHDALENTDGVLETILSAIDTTPSPPLPRKREREHAATGADASIIRSVERTP